MVAVIALFVVKNKEIYRANNQQNNGLVYSTTTLENLINKDGDGDGIIDWQESLYGLDPTKKETAPGVPDITAIEKLKAVSGGDSKTVGTGKEKEENLTQTDKFSRELFSTMVALNQNGAIDQETIDKLSASLAEQIQNPVIRKVFLISDIKVVKDNSDQAIINYLKTFDDIHKKYPDLSYSTLDVLQEFMVNENDVNVKALTKLGPIIEQNNKIISALTKMDVPQSMSTAHLDIINSLERLGENAVDIQFFDTDPIMALGSISQYENNVAQLETSLNNLTNIVRQKLNS